VSVNCGASPSTAYRATLSTIPLMKLPDSFLSMGNNKLTRPKVTQVVRNIRGIPLFRIRIDPATGVQRGFDGEGTFKGTYRPVSNKTHDAKGRPVSMGNALPAVILDCVCTSGTGRNCWPMLPKRPGKSRPKNG
jgi:hypothetical protein